MPEINGTDWDQAEIDRLCALNIDRASCSPGADDLYQLFRFWRDRACDASPVDTDTYFQPTFSTNPDGGINLSVQQYDVDGNAVGAPIEALSLQERLLDSCGNYLTSDTQLKTISPIIGQYVGVTENFLDPAQAGLPSSIHFTTPLCQTIANNECVPVKGIISFEFATVDTIMQNGIASVSQVFLYSIDGGASYAISAWSTFDAQPDQSTINRDAGNTHQEVITLPAGGSIDVCIREQVVFDGSAVNPSAIRTLTPPKITWDLHEA